MSTTRIRRQFSSGSRPAPDPYDKYLEHEGFYRKHTARDASCLFRVISEQMFDTQEYHEQTRKDCIDFMVKNKKEYADVSTFRIVKISRILTDFVIFFAGLENTNRL